MKFQLFYKIKFFFKSKLNVFENITWLILDRFIKLAISIFFSLWIARYLGPKQFGFLNYLITYVGIFSTFVSLGLQKILVRDIVREPNNTGIILGTSAVIQLFSGLLSYIFCIYFITILRPNDSNILILCSILGSTLIFKSLEISTSWFESKTQSKYIVWVQISIFFIFSILKFLILYNFSSLFYYICLTTIEMISSSFILFFLMNKVGLKIKDLKFNLQRANILLNYSLPLLITSIASTINMKIDQLMLGFMKGDEILGIYSAAVKVSEVWYFSIGVIITSISPYIIKSQSKNNIYLHQKWILLYRFLFYYALLITILIFLFSNNIISLLYGNAFLKSTIILKMHSLGGLSVAIGSVWNYWILLNNKLKFGLYSQLIAALLNICSNLLLIPQYGALGAVYSTLISYFLSLFISFFLYKPKINFWYLKNAICFK